MQCRLRSGKETSKKTFTKRYGKELGQRKSRYSLTLEGKSLSFLFIPMNLVEIFFFHIVKKRRFFSLFGSGKIEETPESLNSPFYSFVLKNDILCKMRRL